MNETRQVRSLIGEAMQEEQPAKETSGVTPQPPPDQAADPRFEGLRLRYRAVIVQFCTRTAWTRTDFDTLVRKHSLMPSGTLDVINEWSRDRFDEPIIEHDGDDLIVHAGLVWSRCEHPDQPAALTPGLPTS